MSTYLDNPATLDFADCNLKSLTNCDYKYNHRFRDGGHKFIVVLRPPVRKVLFSPLQRFFQDLLNEGHLTLRS